MQSLGDYLVLNANRYPDNIAIVDRDQRISYRELNQRINRMAHHLLDLGVRKGDRVGMMFHNSSQIVEILYAAGKIGAVAVPLNFRMIPAEVKWCLDSMKCKVLAYSERCAGQVAPVRNALETVEHFICSGEHAGSGEHDFDKFTQDGSADEPHVTVEPDDRSLIIFTGGTTGRPKGALHTHRSIMFCCLNTLINNYLADPSETAIMQAPMFHIVGLNLTNCLMTIGGKIVIVGESFDAVEILRLVEKERATYILLVPPTTYARLLDAPDFKNFDTSTVTKLHNTGGFLPRELMERLFNAFPNANIKYGYGQSESPIGTFLWLTRSMVENGADAVNSIGRASPLVEIQLTDEKGKRVAAGEPGGALIRGPHIMQGYFDQPDLTAETLKDGWIHTGDVFRQDKDGFYYFVDRKKDVIKSGGENVFAAEVEQVILSHPSVEGCAVIGIPDLKFGEAVMAVVKLKSNLSATEEEIIAFCKAHLSSYKKPRRVVFVEAFPQSETGKVLKAKLREKYASIEGA